jgi:hypothetical protein
VWTRWSTVKVNETDSKNKDMMTQLFLPFIRVQNNSGQLRPKFKNKWVLFLFFNSKLVYSIIRDEQSTSITKPINRKECRWYSIQTTIITPINSSVKLSQLIYLLGEPFINVININSPCINHFVKLKCSHRRKEKELLRVTMINCFPY